VTRLYPPLQCPILPHPSPVIIRQRNAREIPVSRVSWGLAWLFEQRPIRGLSRYGEETGLADVCRDFRVNTVETGILGDWFG